LEVTDIKEKINLSIPKQHKIVMQYSRSGKLIYIITQNTMNGMYTLFSVSDNDKLTKIKTARVPTDFEEVYP